MLLPRNPMRKRITASEYRESDDYADDKTPHSALLGTMPSFINPSTSIRMRPAITGIAMKT